MTKGYLRFLAMAAVIALVAAACGDSGSSIGDADEAPEATSGGLFGDDGGDGDDQPPVTVGNIPGLSGECEALINVFLSMGTIFTGGDFSGVNMDAFNDLPGDLQDDAATVVDTLNAYAQGLQDLGVDLSDPQAFVNLTPAQQAAFGGLAESVDSDEFNDAADRLSAYGEAECDQFAPLG